MTTPPLNPGLPEPPHGDVPPPPVGIEPEALPAPTPIQTPWSQQQPAPGYGAPHGYAQMPGYGAQQAPPGYAAPAGNPAQGYGYPPPPYGYAPPAPSNGMATASLILGIVALFVNTLLVPSILAIVFGAKGRNRARLMFATTRVSQGNGPATAGLVLGIIALVESVLLKWMFLFII